MATPRPSQPSGEGTSPRSAPPPLRLIRPGTPHTWGAATHDPQSGASLGLPEVDDFQPDGPRFQPGGLLGAGGMGEVRVARDATLDRDVAMKTPRRPDATGQLLHEARLTARLEHPGIVPVHDAGVLPDGQPYYTMRLLRGSSLADALARARTQAERLSLVRRLQDVAHAMAFAHARGVIHRDLKPSNIMVGEYGETVVSDWGLAVSDHEATSLRGSAGTPGYMAPEQDGGPVDHRADVYAVGAMLHELLYGAPPPAPATSAPAELAAIAARATMPRPADRYPDMGALADDLGAWFEGRRVSAHAYSPRELALRLVRAWRAPLVVAAVAVVGIAVAITLGWVRTAAERDRALVAESEAVQARQQAWQHLASALVAQARQAAATERRAEAEVLAAHALQVGPSPEARGVLARFGGRPRPELLRRDAMPPCAELTLSVDGSRATCHTAGELRLLDLDHGVQQVASLNWHAHLAAFAGDARTLVFFDAESGLYTWTPPAQPEPLPPPPTTFLRLRPGRSPGSVPVAFGSGLGHIEVGRGTWWITSPCEDMSLAEAFADRDDGRVIAACRDGRVVQVGQGEVPRSLLTFPTPHGGPSSLAWSPEGFIAVGGSRGDVQIATPQGQLQRLRMGEGTVRRLLLDDTHVAVSTDHGDLTVARLDTGASVLRTMLPGAALAWREGGAVLRTVGAHVSDWRLPPPAPPQVLPMPAGVSAVAVDPQGDRLAIGLGDGSIHVHQLHDGGEVTRLPPWQEFAIKDLAFSPDGRLLAAATGTASHQHLLETDQWSVASELSILGARRIGWLGGRVVTAGFAPVLLAHTPIAGGWEPQTLVQADVWDLDLAGDRGVAVSADGALWLLHDTPLVAEQAGTFPGAGVVAALGEDVIVGGFQGLSRVHPPTASTLWTMEGRVTEVATSPDHRWVAAGLLDGRILLLDAEQATLLALLEGHTARISALEVSADGAWLVSGSWDSTVRVWSTSGLETPPEVLMADVQAAWQLELDDVLASMR